MDNIAHGNPRLRDREFLWANDKHGERLQIDFFKSSWAARRLSSLKVRGICICAFLRLCYPTL
jgi:hypothetical protein